MSEILKRTKFLKSFEVLELFGHKNISFNFANPSDDDLRDVNVLYGQNGRGKTRVIRLLYSVLSWAGNQGNKNYLAKTPFRSLAISFYDGSSIELVKLSELTGSYSMRHSSPPVERNFRVDVDQDGDVTRSINPSSIREIDGLLAEINTVMFYIDDERKYRTTSSTLKGISEVEPSSAANLYGKQSTSPTGQSGQISVVRLSRAITSQFRRDVLEDAVFGQTNSDVIYRDLISILAGHSTETPSSPNRAALISRIDELERLIKPAVTLGAIPSFEGSFFKDVVTNADDRALSRINLAIVPYLDGLKARIDAVSSQVDRMNLFVSELNRFYQEKVFSFSVKDGFRISGEGGNIRFSWLSSGERQLFIIMASVFLTQGSAGLVLIDEPELSLNVLWQREFVGSLQRLSAHANVQYVLASHSLDILSSDAANVIEI